MPDEPVLTPTSDGTALLYRGRHLYSPEAPRTSAARRARGTEIPQRTLLFVPSLALGYGLDALLERCPPSSHVLCVEVDQTLMALGSRGVGGPLPSDPRLSVLRTDNPTVVAAFLKRLGPGRFRRSKLASLSGGYLLFRSVYDAMFRALEATIAEHWQNRMTSIHLAALWVKNCLDNLGLLPGSVELASLRAPGPVVVLGAGPSLDRVIPLLRRLEGRARLLAVDTALPVLAAHGLRPDLVCILEAQQANIYDFLPLPDRRLPVVADLTASPASLRLFHGPLAFVLSDFAALGVFERMERAGIAPRRIPPLGSVGVTACAVALELTPEEVLTCGLDFAYDGDRTHARGAPLHTRGIDGARRLDPGVSFFYRLIRRRPVIRLGPGPLLTDSVMQSYGSSLAALAAATGRIRRLMPDGSVTTWSDPASDALPHGEPSGEGVALPLRAARRQLVAVRAFYHAELALIPAALSAIEGLLAGGRPPTAGEREALEAVDYASAHFPEAAGPMRLTETPSPSYLARLRQSLLVYRHRLERLASRAVAEPDATEPRA